VTETTSLPYPTQPSLSRTTQFDPRIRRDRRFGEIGFGEIGFGEIGFDEKGFGEIVGNPLFKLSGTSLHKLM
jgi:hypothetical protein